MVGYCDRNRQRSKKYPGQRDIKRIYQAVHRLKDKRIRVVAVWSNTNEKITAAKEELKDQIKRGLNGQAERAPSYVAKATIPRIIQSKISDSAQLSKSIGAAIKSLDKSFPGRHTRAFYAGLQNREASKAL